MLAEIPSKEEDKEKESAFTEGPIAMGPCQALTDLSIGRLWLTMASLYIV